MKGWVVLATLLISVSAWADKGIGAILVRDADTYTSANGDKVEYHLKAGTIVGFSTVSAGWAGHKDKNGFHFATFRTDNHKSMPQTTWIKEDDLEFFYYECTSRGAGGLWTGNKTCVPTEGMLGDR